MRMTLSNLADELDWGRIAGICARKSDGTIDPRVTMLANRAQARMLTRGDWVGSIQLVKFCISEGCITFPRQIERVDAAMLNGQVLDIRNPWYSFMAPLSNSCGNGYYYGYGPFNLTGADLSDRGQYATFRDIIPGSKKLRIYPDSPGDVGKEVLVQAFDDNNQNIIEDSDYNGFKMTVALPYVESAYFVSSITGVIKPKTDRNLNLYEADVNGSLRLLAIYEPGETTVELRRYRLPTTCGTCTNQTFLALVKLKHVPVELDSDYLVIQNPGAFEEMIRALEYKDAGQQDKALRAELDSVKELNLQKRNSSPSDQITIAISTQGNAQPWKHGVGRF